MEADLLRFYDVDLLDLWRGELSWRRLGVLVRQLPREAATVREQHGDVALWGDSEHLLAVVADHLAAANWQRAQAGSKKKIRHPRPIPRPGQADTRDGTRMGDTDLDPEKVKAILRDMGGARTEVATSG